MLPPASHAAAAAYEYVHSRVNLIMTSVRTVSTGVSIIPMNGASSFSLGLDEPACKQAFSVISHVLRPFIKQAAHAARQQSPCRSTHQQAASYWQPAVLTELIGKNSTSRCQAHTADRDFALGADPGTSYMSLSAVWRANQEVASAVAVHEVKGLALPEFCCKKHQKSAHYNTCMSISLHPNK